MALGRLGLAAIGLLGVWNWKVKGTDKLIPGLAAVPWKGRVVYIVFDHDPKPETRSNVDAAGRRLAAALVKAGAVEVRSVELPAGTAGAKQGVDDFLVARGPVAFGELVGRAPRLVSPSEGLANVIVPVIPIRPPVLWWRSR